MATWIRNVAFVILCATLVYSQQRPVGAFSGGAWAAMGYWKDYYPCTRTAYNGTLSGYGEYGGEINCDFDDDHWETLGEAMNADIFSASNSSCGQDYKELVADYMGHPESPWYIESWVTEYGATGIDDSYAVFYCNFFDWIIW